MADFRLIPDEPGITYISEVQSFVVDPGAYPDIALWGGGPSGENLIVDSTDRTVIEAYDISYVSPPVSENLHRISLKAIGFGECVVEARLGPSGPCWAQAAVAVGFTPGTMRPAPDAPTRGSIPVAVGMAAVVRIPVPGTNGLCLEFSPRGWVPKSGSTSTVFIQDGNRVLRLDHGYNTKSGTIDYHWNQKGTFADFGIADHTTVGQAGKVLYKGARYFRPVGRVLVVVGAAIDIYSIVVSSKPLRQATKVVAGWGGAWIGCKTVGAGGAWIGTAVEPGLGTAIGGVVGCIAGSFIGYEGASYTAGRLYDWAEGTDFSPVPEAAGAP